MRQLICLLISETSLAGDREHFEDRLTIQPEYVPHAEEEDGSNPTPTGNPAAPAAPGATTTSTAAQPAARPAAGSDKAERCSYAGVFDGHSAADAAQTAAQRLHVLLAGELGSCTRYGAPTGLSHATSLLAYNPAHYQAICYQYLSEPS